MRNARRVSEAPGRPPAGVGKPGLMPRGITGWRDGYSELPAKCGAWINPRLPEDVLSRQNRADDRSLRERPGVVAEVERPGQVGVAHQVSVDGVGSVAAFGDG